MGRHITDRTAVYGPVCTVVWEGSGREARPYPDQRVKRVPARRDERNPWCSVAIFFLAPEGAKGLRE